jgi:hypothetical protein
VADEALAWELLKHIASPPMMRLFPLATGHFPSRQSMLPQWQDFQKRESARTDDDLRAISESLDHQWVTATFQVVEFGGGREVEVCWEVRGAVNMRFRRHGMAVRRGRPSAGRAG